MRILLACHEPPSRDATALDPAELAIGLAEAGHTVRLWDASAIALDDGPAPRLAAPSPTRRFRDLTDPAIADYLDAGRRRLDELVRWFDPDVIHTDYLWLLAYLALESGVPYVASVRGPELTAYRADPRYANWAQQAAENAGRLFVAQPAVAASLAATLCEIETPVETLRAGRDAIRVALPAAYSQVREDRCGLLAARS